MSTTESYINIVNRNQIQIKGVKDVISYDSEKIILDLEDAELILVGNNFNIKKVDIENNHTEISGILNSLSFSDSSTKVNKSFLASLFK